MTDLNNLSHAELINLCNQQRQQLQACHSLILAKRISTEHRRLMRNLTKLCQTDMKFKDMAAALGVSKRYCRELRRKLESLGMVTPPHCLESRQKTAVCFPSVRLALVSSCTNTEVKYG
ncbi:hypothetical protein DS2_10332 [Catenovulum agarivorans DS-2]|uniref:Uncharacterized protein n=1 Tax=Catenovulum agarivorans DS-2 TaxID=1328313 RepID=W7QX33_9ALTE|nr:hypothetical protein [Catenovulum agarivorans]EWH09840.1 hypothetical protein DS2_10332 [Catenovulum agarivorans DS-2]